MGKEKVIKTKELIEWIYRVGVLYILYECWYILEGFVNLTVRLYGQ